MIICADCGMETRVRIMSMYSTAELCMRCKDAETKRTDYAAAEAADVAAIKSGDFNFPGVGR